MHGVLKFLELITEGREATAVIIIQETEAPMHKMTYTSTPYRSQLKFREYQSLAEDNRNRPSRDVIEMYWYQYPREIAFT